MSNFKINNTSLLGEPYQCAWKFRVVGYDGNGLSILGPYAQVRLTRTWMTNAQFDEWYAKSPQDGYTTAISITVPAPDDGTFTLYAGCYIESVSGSRVDDSYVQDVEIVVGKVAY